MTNLIFNEHSKLLQENKILNNQIKRLDLLNSNLIKQDSIRLKIINRYEMQIKLDNQIISNLDKSIKKEKKHKNTGYYISAGLGCIIIALLVK